MKFEEVLPALRDGKRIARESWRGKYEMGPAANISVDEEAILADDWEIVETPEEKLHRERHEWAIGWLERVLEESRIWTSTDDLTALRKAAKEMK